jgi:hypothetical protein
MTRDVARRLLFLLLRASSASAAVVFAGGAVGACYSGGGGGTDPPTTTFYFPVGLAVSSGGNALYAINSDFDLQWNGGTLQSYDLFQIRLDTAALIQANLTGKSPGAVAGPPYNVQFVQTPPTSNCLTDPNGGVTNPDGTRVALGEICAPPVQSTNYVRSSTVIGAFATDLQLQTVNGNVGHRLFAPVRGDATVTWSNVGPDDPNLTPPKGASAGASFPPFILSCSDTFSGTAPACASRAGNTVDPADSRQETMPGEPFGLAQTEDGSALAVTHQVSTDTSLLTAGTATTAPSMQFVETDVANGGSGIAFVPHSQDSSVPPCQVPVPLSGVSCVRPAFLETSHATAELDLLRFYDDDGSGLLRPFLAKEATFPFATNVGGSDSRGIAIDPTPRLACKAKARPGADKTICGDLPARVFFANRTPPSLVIGEIGGTSATGDGSYNPDLLTLSGNVPLPVGPSRVYVAPIVNVQGNYEVRVFVVNFDSSTISVYDPNNSNLALVDTINVGPGPFAMAFDPFALADVAANMPVKMDPRKDPRLPLDQIPNLRRYRFAYVASFTQSFVQVIDLDQTQPTFESVVFTLGKPTPPKGS